MDDRIAELEQAVAELAGAVREIGGRVAQLEARMSSAWDPASSGVPRSAQTSLAEAESGTGQATDAVAVFSLVGRTCLVLGGGYLLRALTDAGALPRFGGAALGFAYAVGWLAAAWRALGNRRPASGAFHATAAVLVAFPLLWESVVRFHLLSQASAAMAMACVSIVGLAIAWHRRAQPVAWIVSGAGVFAAIAFIGASATAAPGVAGIETGPAVVESAAPMALYVTLVGVFAVWLAYGRRWTALRWPIALVADLIALVMLVNATGAWHQEQPAVVILIELVLLAGYAGSFVARAVRATVGAFEVAQTVALLAVAFGGAVHLVLVTGIGPIGLGVGSLLAGLANYAAAFLLIDWRQGARRSFVYCASLGVTFVIAGTALVAASPVAALIWVAAGAAAALFGRRCGSLTLAAHAGIFIAASAVASGLLAHATEGLAASAAQPWDGIAVPGLIVLVAAALLSAMPLCDEHESWGRWSRAPKVLAIVLLLWTAGGTVCAAIAPPLAGQPGSVGADAAVVAAVRTIVLAAAVLVLGWAGRAVLMEARWLMPGVLVAGGMKLLIEDFPNGRPATLFLALAVYGTALILGPRLRGRAASAGDRLTHAPAQRV